MNHKGEIQLGLYLIRTILFSAVSFLLGLVALMLNLWLDLVWHVYRTVPPFFGTLLFSFVTIVLASCFIGLAVATYMALRFSPRY